MMTLKVSRPLLAVVVASALILAMGGLAVASNMGFKLNKPIVFAGTGQVGSNWTSLPFNNPYGTGAGLCSQLGLLSSGTARGTLVVLNESTGAQTQCTCGTTQCTSLTLISGKGINIKEAVGTGAPTSVIIVGSHNPTLSITIPKAGTGQVGNLWYSVPYHTTAVTAADLCNQIGMASSGTARGLVTRLNPSTGAFTQGTCGASSALSLNLVLGEHVQLRNPTAISFIPAHY